MEDILRGILGIVGLLFICYLCSSNRRAINWKLVGTGVCLTIILAFLILRVQAVRSLFDVFSSFFVLLLGFSKKGSEFLFGSLITNPANGYIFALQALPVIVFFSAITSVLYYLGILQKVVSLLARLLQRSFGLSGAESLSASANIFLGQTEAPLAIKPYLKNLNESELLLVMTGGMATIAGSVLAAYVGFLGGANSEQQVIFATHLLCASIIATPASIVCSKMFIPQMELIEKEAQLHAEKSAQNVLDAVADGTTEGFKLAVNVAVMLLVFISFIALFNYFFEQFLGERFKLNAWVHELSDGQFNGFNLQFLLGYLMAPMAWLMGVPTADVLQVGRLLGEKTILNEFVAYISLGEMKENGTFSQSKSIIISTYALCGFANFSSIGIQIAGIGVMAPSRKAMASNLAFKSMIAGSLASFLTAAVVGMMV